MKKTVIYILVLLFILTLSQPSFCAEYGGVNAKSAVLMEAKTGEVIYEYNSHQPLPPASVTKVMTLLLTAEALDAGKIALTDTVTVSEYAASMGGSQIYLSEGEKMSLEDILKSVIIASANDGAVALAEHICGSEEAFVHAMNKRAAELGLTDTRFENTNGLDDTVERHLTSAYDIAVMSRELIKYPVILKYSGVWMDTIRNGAFTLTNTNKLVRFYQGATGLKTGSTGKAGYCVTATAERDGLSLIAVIMGAETRDIRNAEAKKLLDFGFANYAVYEDGGGRLEDIAYIGGDKENLTAEYPPVSLLLDKGKKDGIVKETVIKEGLSAPIEKGEAVGEVTYFYNGEALMKCEIKVAEEAKKITFFQILYNISKTFFSFC